MFRIQLSPCSSAQTRQSGTLPPPIVRQRSGATAQFKPSFPSLTFRLCDPRRHDDRGAGHRSGYRDPRADRGWRQCLSGNSRRRGRQERVQLHRVQSFPGWVGEDLNNFFLSVILDASRLTGSVRPQKQAYMISSGVICIIYLLCTLVLFLGVKERKGTRAKRIVVIRSVSLPTT